jgi:serine/threonine protein phosphatase PrpC
MELLTKEETKCGSTAVSVLLVEDTLYIANLGMKSLFCSKQSIHSIVSKLIIAKSNYQTLFSTGDSEAVLAKRLPPSETPSAAPSYNAELLTIKHKPSDPSEKERVEKNGGHVIFGRVLGSLAVSRAFGDIEFKFPYNKGGKHRIFANFSYPLSFFIFPAQIH